MCQFHHISSFKKALFNRSTETHTQTHGKGPGLNLSLTHASHNQRLVTTVKSVHAATPPWLILLAIQQRLS